MRHGPGMWRTRPRLALLVALAPLAAAPIAQAQWMMPRWRHAMVFDSRRGVMVLFGGGTTSGVVDQRYSGQTWEWDGARWSLRSSAGPAPRAGHTMAYDSGRGVTVLYGGYSAEPGALRDTWEWDGTTWARRADAPWGSAFAAMVYDSARAWCVLYGGGWGVAQWAGPALWDGAAWSMFQGAGPGPRERLSMAYDSTRGLTVLAGGIRHAGVPRDTWEWDGAAWTNRGAAPTMYDFAAAFDAARGVTVLALGNFVWEWDSTSWTQHTAPGPTALYGAFAYSPTLQRCLLHGGIVQNTALSAEMWAWDGAAWAPLGAPCYANCDGSTAPPVLNVADFQCFMTRFAAGDPAANCDGSSSPPALSIADFICFVNAYAAGCV